MSKNFRINKRAAELLKLLNKENVSILKLNPYAWRDLRLAARENGLFQIKITLDKPVKVKKEYKKSTVFA